MFNQNIKDNIEDTIIQLEKEMNTKNEMVDFIRNFLSNNSFQGIHSVETLNLVDLFITNFISTCENKEFNFEEIKNIAYRNQLIFSELNSPTFSTLFNIISYVASEFELDELSNFFKKDGEMLLTFDNPFIVAEKYASIMTLATIGKKYNCDVLSLIKLTKQYYNDLSSVLSLVHGAIQLKELVELYTDDLSLYQDIANLKMSEKNSSKTIKENIKADYDISMYEADMLQLRDYCIHTINMEESRHRELRKQINNYRVVQAWMDKTEKQNIENSKPISIDSSVLKISSEDIKVDILKSIYLKNYQTAQELKQTYEILSNNSVNHYKRLLKKYNISISEDEIVFDMNVKDLEKSLEVLKKTNITDSKILLKITQFSNLETITQLCSYINRGILNTTFILEHVDLFSNHHKLNSLTENIEFLQEEKITTTYIQKMKNVLLEAPELLKENITVLKEYNLLKFYKKTKSYEFLCSSVLADNIDIMLELGYETNLEENLSLLNYSKDDYKKLEILKRLNTPLNNTEEIEKVLNNPHFIIYDDNLDNYISDFSNYPILDREELSKSKFIEKLEKNKDEDSTSRVYSFQGLMISKNKVRREIEKIDKESLTVSEQFKCLSKNQLLNSENYLKIRNMIVSDESNEIMKVKK